MGPASIRRRTGGLPPHLRLKNFEALRENAARGRIVNRSLTDLLMDEADGSKQVYVLPDAQDWMNDQQLNAVRAEITRTATPGARLFRRRRLDRIFISYGVLMIPDWQAALRMACALPAPGGQLHVVDFSDQHGWPAWFGNRLNGWLGKFHVTPRPGLQEALADPPGEAGGTLRYRQLYFGYAQYGVVEHPR